MIYLLCVTQQQVFTCVQTLFVTSCRWNRQVASMMTSSTGNIFRVTGPLCGEFTGPPVNSLHWRGALMFSLIRVSINGWENNRETGDLRRYRAHYDVIVMKVQRDHYFGLSFSLLICINFRLHDMFAWLNTRELKLIQFHFTANTARILSMVWEQIFVLQ